MKRSLKKFAKVLFSIIIVGLIYTGGYAVGHRNIEFEKGYIPKIVNTNLGAPKDIDFSLFWDTMDITKEKFLGSADEQKMVYGAISGMVGSLGDPYTFFMTPEEANRFNTDLKGQFEGIGAELEPKDGYLVVVSPLASSPAEKAGIMPNDIITKIDGVEVGGLNFYDAVDKIRGKKDTVVALTIVRSGFSEPKEFKVTRGTIVVKSVNYEMKGDIGYIKMTQFGDDTVELMNEAVDNINEKNPKGIIIDLRNNPGGYVEDAVSIAGMFLDKGKVVVMEKGKDGAKNSSQTTTVPKMKDTPMLILVNDGSASASEILSGALQDYGRAKLVGIKTFGKGSVQSVNELKGGAQVKITIAEWLTPNGRQINKIGIEPDIKVELTSDDKSAGRDPQLDRALEELRK
jgi:carboxyl-terminal processing protease